MKRIPSLILGLGVGIILGNNTIFTELLGLSKNLFMVLGFVVMLIGVILIAMNKDGLGKS